MVYAMASLRIRDCQKDAMCCRDPCVLVTMCMLTTMPLFVPLTLQHGRSLNTQELN